jgi:hypothetical protein
MRVKLLRHEPVETSRVGVAVNLVVRRSCGGGLPADEVRWG